MTKDLYTLICLAFACHWPAAALSSYSASWGKSNTSLQHAEIDDIFGQGQCPERAELRECYTRHVSPEHLGVVNSLNRNASVDRHDRCLLALQDSGYFPKVSLQRYLGTKYLIPQEEAVKQRRGETLTIREGPGITRLHTDPDVFLVRNLTTPQVADSIQMPRDPSISIARPPVNGCCSLRKSHTRFNVMLPDSLLARVEELLGRPRRHFEPQIATYGVGDFYGDHFDNAPCGEQPVQLFSAEKPGRFWKGQGPSTGEKIRMAKCMSTSRKATVLLYLTDDHGGGETDFPDLDLRVSPEKGSAVVFFPTFLTGEADPFLRHAALDVTSGEKRVVQLWVH